MSNELNTVKSSMGDLQNQVDNVTNSTGQLQSRVSSGGTDFVKFGLGVAAAAGGIINLVHQYHNLQRAQNSFTITQNRAKNAQTLYNKAVHDHGKNSEEAKKALRNLNNAQIRVKNSQVSLNDRMTDFAFSIVPSVVGVVAGLAQTFQILGGGRGIGGLGTGFLKFGGLLVVAGAALFAFKTNLFGFRDAINQIGVAIGNAIPALKPFLNFLSNLATLIGLQPGNKKAAAKFVNNFIDAIKKAFVQAQEQVQKIISKLFSGDIAGTIKQITFTIKDIARHIIIDGTPLDQLPTRIKNHFMAAMAKHKGDIFNATADVLVFLGNILFGTVKGGKTGKQIPFGDAIREGIQARIDEAKGNPLTLFINFNDFFNAQIEPVDPFAEITKPWADSFHNALATISSTLFGNIKGVTDLANTFVNWFTTNILTPIVDTWNNILVPSMKTEFTALFKNNPIFQKFVVGDILGAVSLAANDIVNWFTTNILTPITDTWQNTIVPSFTNFFKSKPLFKAGKNIIDDILGTVDFLAGEAKLWFQKNILKPIQDAWNTASDMLKKATGGILDIGQIKLVPSDVEVDLRNSKFINKMNELANKGFRGQGPGNGNGINLPIDTVMLQPQSIQISDIPSSGGGGAGGDIPGFQGNTVTKLISLPVDTLNIVPKTITFGDILTQAAITETAIIALFNQVFVQLSAGFSGLANTASAVFNSMGANAVSGATQIISAMATVFTTVSAGMSGLASTWSAVCNSFGANAQSGASQIISAMNNMLSTATSIFNKLASNFSKTMSAMVSSSKKAISAILSEINKLNTTVTTIHRIVTQNVSSNGPHAKGGVFYADKPTSAGTFGEAGPELAMFLPLKGKGAINTGSVSGPVNLSASRSTGGGGTTIVQVFLDGRVIRGVLSNMIVQNQGAYK